MLETNIRIVQPGKTLYVNVRRMTVEGQNPTTDLLERLCGTSRYRYGVAAVRDPESDSSILVATYYPLRPMILQDGDYEITAKDSGEAVRRLSLSDATGERIIPTIIERALLARVAKLNDLWSLSSPRIWYESSPFATHDEISAYRRFELASISIKDVGVGVIADIGTAFFTNHSLEYFFDPALPDSELKRREEAFSLLTARQEGQKGTLIYDNGRRKVTCYFENAPIGVTCASSGPLLVKGNRYSCLHEYYQKEYPSLSIKQGDPVVRVSFPGIDRPQGVAAKLVRIRVMNESLPESMSSVDKIPPQERKKFLEDFWKRMDPEPLGKVAPGLRPGFWQPDERQTVNLVPPELEFGGSTILPAPANASTHDFRSYYRNHLEYLEKAHCYRLNPSAPRILHFVYPASLDKDVAERCADDIVRQLSKWTGLNFTCNILDYTMLNEAFEKLRRDSNGGAALFILNNEPAAYYNVAFNLPTWRVKRVTIPVLTASYAYLNRGAWDKKLQKLSLDRGRTRWDSFVTMTALDILQLLDNIPYRIRQAGPFEGQLVIDVGHDRRFFSISILIARSSDKKPSFHIYTRTQHKADWKKESINPVILKDEIINLLKDALGRHFDPLGSLIVLRDGRLQKIELKAIDDALVSLHSLGMVSGDARIEIVGVHKGTLDQIRLWEVAGNGYVCNPLEGSGVILTPTIAVLTSTGDATLTQGTADPLVLVSDGQCKSMADAALSTFEAAQLNWSSPGVAQRLPLPIKRTDEELEARAAQEVRRIK